MTNYEDKSVVGENLHNKLAFFGFHREDTRLKCLIKVIYMRTATGKINKETIFFFFPPTTTRLSSNYVYGAKSGRIIMKKVSFSLKPPAIETRVDEKGLKYQQKIKNFIKRNEHFTSFC